jgi:hypothetical protein
MQTATGIALALIEVPLARRPSHVDVGNGGRAASILVRAAGFAGRERSVQTGMHPKVLAVAYVLASF